MSVTGNDVTMPPGTPQKLAKTTKGTYSMTTTYIDNATYRKQKSALTRAINSKNPLKVLAACEAVLKEWAGVAWPDDWNRWRIALDDAYWELLRDPDYYMVPETQERFSDALQAFA